MKRRLISILLVFSLLSILILPVIALAADAWLLEYYNSNDDSSGIANTTRWKAQTFTTDSSCNVTSAKVKIYREGSPNDIYVSIQGVDGEGQPDGSDLCSGTTNGNTLTASSPGEWREIDFTVPTTLAATTQYALVIYTQANQIRWRGDGSSPTYAGGMLESSEDAGATWSHNSGWDMMFELWGVSNNTTLPDTETLAATDIEYDPYIEWFNVTLNGNLTDDGGENCFTGFQYQVKDAADWQSAACTGIYNTSNNFTFTIPGLIPETTYEFFAYSINSQGTDEGDTLEFTTNYPSGVAPNVVTYAYPIIKSSDNLTARLYGGVLTDGGDNVTAWFQYRDIYPTTGNWTATSNTTGLTTGDGFNNLISSLSLYPHTYEYQAIGQNVSGNATGGIAYFYLEELTNPEVETLDASFITDTEVYFSANVTDDGGGVGGCFVQMQYREVGKTVWLTTSGYWLNTDEIFLKSVYDLTPDTNYEYRAYAWDYDGEWNKLEGFGEIKVFRTYETYTVPVVTTGNVTLMMSTAVELAGTLTYHGNLDCELGFQYRIIGADEWTETDKTLSTYSPADYTRIVYDIIDGEKYEYRAIGINNEGYGYGEILKFNITDGVLEDEGYVFPWWDGNPLTPVTDGLGDTAKSVISLLLMGIILFFSNRKWHNKKLSIALTAIVFILLVIFEIMPIWLTIVVAMLIGLYIFKLVKK